MSALIPAERGRLSFDEDDLRLGILDRSVVLASPVAVSLNSSGALVEVDCIAVVGGE